MEDSRPNRFATAAGERGFKRYQVIAGLVMLAAEIVFIVLPLVHLSPVKIFDSPEMVRLSIPLFLGAQIIWWIVMGTWMRPLYRAVALSRRGKPVPEDLAERAYRMTWIMPLFALALRVGLWLVLAFVHGFVFVRFEGWQEFRVWQVMAITALHCLTITSIRAMWYARLLKNVRERILPDIERLRHFTDRYFSEILLSIVLASAMTAAAVAAFVFFFLPIDLEQYFNIQVVFAPAVCVVVVGVSLVAWRLRQLIDVFLASQLDLKVRMSGVVAAATDVYSRAQSLPYQLAIIHIVLWVAVGVVMGWVIREGWGIEFDDSILMIGIVIVISIGTSLYQMLGHRACLGELLDHVTHEHRMPVRTIKASLSLQSKLLIYFGGMILFAVGLSIFWAFLQYKNLVTKYTADQTELGMAWIRSEVQGALAAQESKPDAEDVSQVLSKLSGRGSDTIVYFLPASSNLKPIAIGGGIAGVPQLPWYTLAQMQNEKDGNVRLKAYSLDGRRGRLIVNWRERNIDLGSVAILHPSYRGRGASMVRPLKELVVFFILLFGACAGIVVVSIGQFVKPIRRLEKRADEMARGELGNPVLSGGEGDEVGRLTFAMESMRKALREKIRTTEESNLDLERAVQTRTADLALRNRELAETLGKLTQAQDQLLQSEKMASIGQLVAGIAHEINNPVNAIVNTVGPLEETLSEMTGGPPDSAEDAKEMINVVRRGAERTKAIVKALHNYSRTDDEKATSVDINASLIDSLELLRHVMLADVEVVKDFGDIGRIRGHAGKLGQVFMNLLTNAAQALPVGGKGRIRVATKVLADDSVEILISDNGSGIPAHVLPRIFDPFFTTKDVGDGTGLGLSIVHGIIERHGGRIDVISNPREGTQFTMVLPRAYDQIS